MGLLKSRVNLPVPPSVQLTAGTGFFIGCSNTYYTVQGYNELEGTNPRRLWIPHPNGNNSKAPYETGAGSLARWDNNERNHQTRFEEVYTPGSEAPIWIQWCIRSGESGGEGGHTIQEGQVDGFLDWLLPFVSNDGEDPYPVMFCSPINTWTQDPPQVVSQTNHKYVSDYTRKEINDRGGEAYDGPKLGTLIVPDETNDGTHPNLAGREKIGQQLFDFFNEFVVVA